MGTKNPNQVKRAASLSLPSGTGKHTSVDNLNPICCKDMGLGIHQVSIITQKYVTTKHIHLFVSPRSGLNGNNCVKTGSLAWIRVCCCNKAHSEYPIEFRSHSLPWGIETDQDKSAEPNEWTTQSSTAAGRSFPLQYQVLCGPAKLNKSSLGPNFTSIQPCKRNTIWHQLVPWLQGKLHTKTELGVLYNWTTKLQSWL